MRTRAWILSSLLALVVAAFVVFARIGDERGPDERPAEAGKDEAVARGLAADGPERPILVGRPMPPVPKGPAPEARRALADRVTAHERAVLLHGAGFLSDHDLRVAAMELLEARFGAGEIVERTLHAGRARLFAEDLGAQLEAGVVSVVDRDATMREMEERFPAP